MFAVTKISAVLALALLVGVAYGRAPKRIVGGSMVDISDYPYQISLRLNGAYQCGGAIISKRHILTAAHCVNGVTPENLKIATGTSRSTGGELHDVVRIVAHSGYSPTDYTVAHDIALITLAKDIKFSWRQDKIDLPTAPTPSGAHVIATGWGLKSAAVQTIAPVLWKADLRTLARDQCAQMFGDDHVIYENQVCTYVRRGLGTCQGDSGGPLAYNDQLVGVVSWGIPCAAGLPDVFTSVYHHLDWIRQHMYSY